MAVPGVPQVEQDGERVVAYGQGKRFACRVVNGLESARIRFRNLRTEQPTLEDVFLTLTGRQMRE